MMAEKACEKDKNQNIQSFVRLRPLNQRERDVRSQGVVEVVNDREVVVLQSHNKKFTFDRAFGPETTQVEVYLAVVSPLIEEVLAGYNCTVFAYGQTGTGKTHTMVGENTSDETNWQNDPLAGIIPRALSQLFDELRISNFDYTVRVSYLELYNEELFDLLSTSEDNSKLRIYEDATRKGSNIVNGLEEIPVYNKNEVFKIMARGQERKRVASTLMNAQSSRSHTVFTVIVHMKENNSEGEVLVKIGKLNLVDLAGSENISKAGSNNPGKRERKRECGNINQSLLTLGRVITALVERHPHIPYRESKLTRILQESLGGRTKTSIIATISPGHKDLDETVGTLEYAIRAKNIQNKPELNRKMTKNIILKEYFEEIDKLKRELQASRDKTGVYLPNETFVEMKLNEEEHRKEIHRLLLNIRALEEQRDKMEAVFKEKNTDLEKCNSELSDTIDELKTTTAKLNTADNLLNAERSECSEQKHLVSRYVNTESTLNNQAKKILKAADTAATHVALLHDAVDRRRNVESTNLEVTRTYRSQATGHRQHIVDTSSRLATLVAGNLQQTHTELESVTVSSCEKVQQSRDNIEQLLQMMSQTFNEMVSLTNDTTSSLQTTLSTHHCSRTSSLRSQSSQLSSAVNTLVQAMRDNLRRWEQLEITGVVDSFAKQWYAGAIAHISSLEEISCNMCSRVTTRASQCRDAAHDMAHNRKHRANMRKQYMATAVAETEAEVVCMVRRLSLEMQQIEKEEQDTRERLEQWARAEIQAVTDMVTSFMQVELNTMKKRLSKEKSSIESRLTTLKELEAYFKKLKDTILKDSEEELIKTDEENNIVETGLDDDIKMVKIYQTVFCEGASAVKCDMEAVTHSVVDLVDQSFSQLLSAMRTYDVKLQKEVNDVTASEEASGKEMTTESERMNERLLNEFKQLIHQTIDKLQVNNTSTSDTLASLSNCLQSMSTACTAYCSSHSKVMQSATEAVYGFDTDCKTAVEGLQDLEEKYLNEQYKVYSPTGNTPRLTEYRYPRSLATTSPHNAILARYRAQNSSTSNDCIVIEPESSNTLNCKTFSICEDSSLTLTPHIPSTSFTPLASRNPLKPIPATDTRRGNKKLNVDNGRSNIVKSTSESDIFNLIHPQEMDKENIASCLKKKPSKLPVPTPNKKPLNQRNIFSACKPKKK